ncbi:MAG: 23S rRNA pseudouridine(1911/1915/1917) synthase RluD [Thiohalomonadales bacterium]
MSENQQLNIQIPESMSGQRLDVALSELLCEYSRSRIQRWIKKGNIRIDGHIKRAKDLIRGGELVAVHIVEEIETAWRPQSISLDIIYEDAEIIVINKPAGMVVHPGAGNMDGTLSNALLYYAEEVAKVPRAGIVHRIDKETSGLLVVARSLKAQKSLVEQLQQRTVTREYQAIVHGVMTAGGSIDEPIGRHPIQRTRMAVVRSGRPAKTHYRLIKKFRSHTHVRVQLETGRTHQIRVHMAHIRYPIVGDPVYGGRKRLPAGCQDNLKDCLRGFTRQALHAAKLSLQHPTTGEQMSWTAELPADMQALLYELAHELAHEQVRKD